MNKEAIAFFTEVNKLLPTDSSNIDHSKLADRDSMASRYVCSKIPEFFSRGSSMLAPYYILFERTRDNSQKGYSDMMLSKLANGDFSDMEKIKEVYPYLQIMYNYINANIGQIDGYTDNFVWEDSDLIGELLDNPEYKEMCKEILNNEGWFKYNNRSYQLREMDTLIEEHPEDKEKLKVAKKIMEIYDLIYEKNLAFNYSNQEELKESYKTEKEIQDKRLIELDGLENQLIEINDKLKKFNFITSIIKRNDKNDLLIEKEKLEKKIKKIKKNVEFFEKWFVEQEENFRLIEMYEKKYIKVMQEKTIPLLKKKLERFFKPEQLE